ncbi:MAG TPA: tyrosine-type recombinase/integrase [Chloroflexota bacterium]|nr:tyrosine-type recombinase/integrase [Chloroflexota bacterium]
MRHPAHVWVDPTFAAESLERLREEYVGFLKGRARSTSSATIDKYSKTLLSFIRFLDRVGEPLVLSNLTSDTVSRWVTEQRERGMSEEGIASRLSALKVFSKRFVFEHLELTTVDLLRKVARITPPERSYPVLTETEQARLLDAFDRGTYEDLRNRAMMAVFLATGMRFSEVLNIDMASFDRVTAEIRVIGKGNKERWVRLSPGALREVKPYLKRRPDHGPSDRMWLTEDGRALT